MNAACPDLDALADAYVRAGGQGICNVRTCLELLEVGGHRFPVSINDGTDPSGNCYVVSPQTTYRLYADWELQRLGRPVLTSPLRVLVAAIGTGLAGARVDRIVWVNNWLLSTNIHPPGWDGQGLAEALADLKRRYPDHAIGLRSLNRFCNEPLMETLVRLGCLEIPSRQVYLFDGRPGPDSEFLRHHNTRMDARLLERSPYRVQTGSDLVDDDFPRLEQLYNLLYLDKYCHLNPMYTSAWIRRGRDEGWLEIRVLRSPEGRIDAVVGWFAGDGVLTAPLVGYDTHLPANTGLYRQATQLCLQEAAARRVVLNFSSGAPGFKRLRGGVPEIESSMLLVDHLPWHRRAAWKALGAVLHGVAVPFIRKMEL